MKKIVIVGIILIITIIGIETFKYLDNSKEVISDEPKEQIKSNDMLTMMLETEDGNYVETTANNWPPEGYVFNAELSKCENGGIVTFNEETQKINMQTNISDKCYIYFDIANQTFANYIIKNVYTEDGANGLYYHDGLGTYTNADQEAGDNSYRYSGANPNNYVCFGSEETTCSEDNLYRIIGIFDDNKDGAYNAKLIKSTRYGSYVRDSENSNTWNETEKPDIHTTLNTSYWNTLTSEWQNKVDEIHKWQVGGMKKNTTYTVKQYYDTEIKNQTGYEETMPVGLMYVSDYGYAANPENWQTPLNDYDNTTNTNNNWLYLGVDENVITRQNDFYTYYTFTISYSGFVDVSQAKFLAFVHPSFYLNSEVKLVSGSGTSTDPYRISI